MSISAQRFFEICSKKAEKDSLKIKLSELKKQEDQLTDKLSVLKSELEKESKDVERLEKKTLSSILYIVINKRVEKLDKEKEEAYLAKLKYDSASAELGALREKIKDCLAALNGLNGIEADYKIAYDERLSELKSSGGAFGEEITILEKEIAEADHQKKELEEAKNVAERAISLVLDIITELESAKSWSTYDVLGGGWLADLSKHEHLDNAQNLIETLQDLLSDLKAELKDVNIDSGIYVRIDGFERFADYFFDNFFTDLTVSDSICSSLSKIESVKYELERTVKKIDEIYRSALRSSELKRKRIENIVISAE